jgi:protein-S-isoprenylcysteine O-methyltransferase Ste14
MAADPRTRLPLVVWRPLAKSLAGLAAMGAMQFAAAGRLDWPQGWVFLALWGVTMALPEIALFRENPGLMLRRARPAEPPPRWERALWACYLPLVLALPTLAGLDAQRFGWSHPPESLVFAGVPLILTAAVLSAWAVTENPHYETRMRVQRDIGHKVVYSGPYRIVRHPGYLAAALAALGAPLVLCSAWSALPAAGLVLVMALRATLEDRALQTGLRGYAAYARQVPTLLLPGIW